MINWNVNEKKFKKENPREYKIWRIVQLINYGLDGAKLREKDIVRNWQNIKIKIDPITKKYFEFLLWDKNPYLIRHRKNFWN